MVFHGFAPTDALDERVRFTDDQIDVFSKAFLGLTVSCARCHDHKFDPISQADYYALFGILSSCRPGRQLVESNESLNRHAVELSQMKGSLRNALVKDWKSADSRWDQLLADGGAWKEAARRGQVLHVWWQMKQDVANGADFADAWQKYAARTDLVDKASLDQATRTWDFTEQQDYDQWFAFGTGLPEKPQPAGSFAIRPEGDQAVLGIYPAGVYSHLVSEKHAARLSSPDFALPGKFDLYLRVRGGGAASIRYVVQDYPRNGTVYPVVNLAGDWRWQKFNLSYWDGDRVHIELTHAKDAPLLVKTNDRSWFGIQQAMLVPKDSPAPTNSVNDFASLLIKTSKKHSPPASFDDLKALYRLTLSQALDSWERGEATNREAMALDACVREGIIPNQLSKLPMTAPLVRRYRQLEKEIPIATRVPGLEESVGRDQALFTRGNHKLPADPVPRRFLSVFDTKAYATQGSGRLELAEDMLRDDNPLLRRVIVNRLWHHVFGQGIVATPDNFGRMGIAPTHPELLDFLATRFAKDGWSLKQAIRLMLTSKTWQLDSTPSAAATERDPGNQLLSHARVRRLEAEAIRDSLLQLAGQLEPRMYGPPVNGNGGRRSVYVRVRRNALDPFLRAFDFPEPFGAAGRRDVTNVPAQSLTLMNDRAVEQYARSWANQIVNSPKAMSNADRVRRIYLQAFSRPPTKGELRGALQFVEQVKAEDDLRRSRLAKIMKQTNQHRQAIQAIKQPIRDRLTQSDGKETANDLPQPMARWEFEKDLRDVIGQMHGKAFGNAKIDDGLLLDGKTGYVVTAPLGRDLAAKTLEAWVQLSNTKQRGGGVMSVQSPDGATFDAIVFGEQVPLQWLAGSNYFKRTESFSGSEDAEADKRVVHIAIVYGKDGTIQGYRDGKPYGKPYRSDGPMRFQAGSSVVGFGVRHLPAGSNKMLAGRIRRAQLYDRALSNEEILASSESAAFFVSEAKIHAAMTVDQQQEVGRREARIQELAAERKQLGDVTESPDPHAAWTELTRAVFCFKEFIYLR